MRCNEGEVVYNAYVAAINDTGHLSITMASSSSAEQGNPNIVPRSTRLGFDLSLDDITR
jgi:hypothetical protein